MDGARNESKENKNKEKIAPQYSNNEKAWIIYDYYMLGAFLIDSGGNCQNNNNKKEEEHNPDTLKHLLYAWGCSKGLLWNFCQGSMLQ